MASLSVDRPSPSFESSIRSRRCRGLSLSKCPQFDLFPLLSSDVDALLSFDSLRSSLHSSSKRSPRLHGSSSSSLLFVSIRILPRRSSTSILSEQVRLSKIGREDFLETDRLFSITGLTALVETNCTDREPYLEKHLPWSDYLNPCVLLILYFYLAFETSQTRVTRRRKRTVSSRHIPSV